MFSEYVAWIGIKRQIKAKMLNSVEQIKKLSFRLAQNFN